MTIQRKPKSKPDESAIEKFIDGGDVSTQPAVPSSEPKARDKKKPVALRFDGGLLARIDAAAREKGISRNAWISYQCSEALDG